MQNKHAEVLFIASHPDDIELGCGGAIKIFAKRGFKVKCIYLTHGEHLADPDLREEESRSACHLLGVKPNNIIFAPKDKFKDTGIPESFYTIDWLEKFYNQDVYAVFIHSEHDFHQDHRVTAKCCLTAFRHVHRILHYESPSIIGYKFTPAAFVDITDTINIKRKALNCHKSQIVNHKIYMEYKAMINLAGMRGEQARVQLAEAFEVSRYLIDPVPDHSPTQYRIQLLRRS